MIVHLDMESYSEIDLTKVGVYRYADDPSTDVLLASYAIGDGPVRRWRPGDPYPFGNDTFLAWNANFERTMWNTVMVRRYGWPAMPIEAFDCVAAQARLTAAAPSKLETAGQFFRRHHQKDRKGHLHMLKMCRPTDEKTQNAWWKSGAGDPRAPDFDRSMKRCHHTDEALDLLHAYCDRDVETERDIHCILSPWRLADLEAYWENEYINDRGVIVDTHFAAAACEFADEEKAWFNERLAKITGNRVTTPRQFQRIKEWALPRMSPAAITVCEFYDAGVKKVSFDADTRNNLIAEDDLQPGFLTEEIREFIEILDQAGKSTISKYETISERFVHDETEDRKRVHGLYMFAGAAQTARFSSMGLQVHNLKREVSPDASNMIDAFTFKRDPRQYGPPIHTLAKLIRPTFTGCPHGDFDLVWGDWSAIEARMLPWLSLDPRADELLARYRRGEDVYLHQASRILGRTITAANKHERQAYGKVPTLACGYQGSTGAFQKMAKAYGVHLPEPEVRDIVAGWREDNPWAPTFWASLETAMFAAMERPGCSFGAGQVQYLFDRDALDGMGCLYAILPSGRRIPYPGARFETVTTPWGDDKLGITVLKASWRPKKDEDEWPRIALYGGLLAENATQAACADLLMLALRSAPFEPWSLRVVLHSHDEIVIESRDVPEDSRKLKALMETAPPWPCADALPLQAEIESGFRYKVKS